LSTLLLSNTYNKETLSSSFIAIIINEAIIQHNSHHTPLTSWIGNVERSCKNASHITTNATSFSPLQTVSGTSDSANAFSLLLLAKSRQQLSNTPS
jgi:hypothetical protein